MRGLLLLSGAPVYLWRTQYVLIPLFANSVLHVSLPERNIDSVKSAQSASVSLLIVTGLVSPSQSKH